MWDWAVELLRESALMRLFLVVGAGYCLGEIKFPGNFRLGIAGVLFAGLAFGAVNPQFILPEDIQALGLVLFVYCVGLEAGPGFVQSFRKDGVRLNAAVTGSLLAGASVVWLAIQFSGRSKEVLVGLFCGALTNTPALGAASEYIARATGSSQAANAAVVGYGVVYPFAVLAVLLLFQTRLALRKGDPFSAVETNSLPQAQTIEVMHTRNGVEWTADEVEAATGAVVTRLRKPAGQMALSRGETKLPPGTHLVVVGSPSSLQAGIDLLGRLASEPLEKNLKGFDSHRYFVSNSAIAGRTLGELGLEKLGAVISRIRRADVDLPVHDGTVLHLGDRVRVVTYAENERQVRKLFGNSLNALSETGYLSFAMGITLGLLLGAIPAQLPGMSEPVRLGIAGGPLIVALILGSLGRTGPVIWNPPLQITLTLKQCGILFFLACAGVKAGAMLPSTLRSDGLFLISLGVSVALISHLVLWLILKMGGGTGLEQVLGSSAGLQTQPAVLSFAANKVTAGPVNVAYATVYPLSLVIKVVLAQVLLTL